MEKISTPTTLVELKQRNHAAHQRFLKVIDGRTDSELLDPRLPDGWSIKDVLAHFAWWDQWLVFKLFPDNPEIASDPPPLYDEITKSGLPLDALNARVFQHNQSRGLTEIKEDFSRAHERAARVAASLSESDVFDPAGRSAMVGRPVAPLVFGIYEHYEEHAHEIEQAFP